MSHNTLGKTDKEHLQNRDSRNTSKKREVIPAKKLMQKERTPIQKRKNSKSKKCREKTRKRGIEKQDGNTD